MGTSGSTGGVKPIFYFSLFASASRGVDRALVDGFVSLVNPGLMPLVIDSHQHFWQLSQPFNYDWLKAPQNAPICRDFLPEHLTPHLAATGVRKTIFVQTQHDLAENR